jgi:hypothetical protein
VLASLGVLVAIAALLVALALTSETSTTVASSVTASQTGVVSPPQVRYMGPRQPQAAALNASKGATAGAADAVKQTVPTPYVPH